MSIKTPNMSRDELINTLNSCIDQSRFKLLTQKELQTQHRVVEGDWDCRLTAFVDDPKNDIPNMGIARDLTRALLTARYQKFVSQATFKKHTRILDTERCKPPRGKLAAVDLKREK